MFDIYLSAAHPSSRRVWRRASGSLPARGSSSWGVKRQGLPQTLGDRQNGMPCTHDHRRLTSRTLARIWRITKPLQALTGRSLDRQGGPAAKKSARRATMTHRSPLRWCLSALRTRGAQPSGVHDCVSSTAFPDLFGRVNTDNANRPLAGHRIGRSYRCPIRRN